MMKKSTMMAMLVGGLGVMGYMYMQKNPQMMTNMRNMVKSAAKKTYNKLEDMED